VRIVALVARHLGLIWIGWAGSSQVNDIRIAVIDSVADVGLRATVIGRNSRVLRGAVRVVAFETKIIGLFGKVRIRLVLGGFKERHSHVERIAGTVWVVADIAVAGGVSRHASREAGDRGVHINSR